MWSFSALTLLVRWQEGHVASESSATAIAKTLLCGCRPNLEKLWKDGPAKQWQSVHLCDICCMMSGLDLKKTTWHAYLHSFNHCMFNSAFLVRQNTFRLHSGISHGLLSALSVVINFFSLSHTVLAILHWDDSLPVGDINAASCSLNCIRPVSRCYFVLLLVIHIGCVTAVVSVANEEIR